MKNYCIDDVCILGKRINNTKRNYLLVNPLQGKHIPVSPTKTYELCTQLGLKLAEKVSDARIIIGFAETATAVGAIASMVFSYDTVYQHTTREKTDSEDIIIFREEHSHAVFHQIDCRKLSELNNGSVILIDDEISTGNTIVNMITELREKFSGLNNIKFVAGSVINRMPDEKIEKLKKEKIEFVYLVKTDKDDFIEKADSFSVNDPSDAVITSDKYTVINNINFPDLRKGMNIGQLKKETEQLAQNITDKLKNMTDENSSAAIIGTEECMLPAIMTGMYMEQKCGNMSVYTHSTTRSPIGVSAEDNYPCKNGFSLPSFYEKDRKTFLYNIKKYDAVVVITDSSDEVQTDCAMSYLAGLFDTDNIILVRG